MASFRSILLSVLMLPFVAQAADWPTYRGDATRSGFTAETIPNQLRLRWQFNAGLPPQPAWPTSERMDFDLAFQPIIVGDLVVFGSSADDQVYALDAKTGAIRWRFFSEGPIRFAPAAWKDRVFVASDDGWFYALALADGKVLWKHRAGPGAEKVFGNERMISHWPTRGGPVVLEDKVYFTGGIWPSDGVFIHALDAESGKPVWANSETGRMLMKQPHGGAEALSGVAPQGYLLATADSLIVPTGRAVPAVFDRADGKLRYYHLQKNQQRGGTRALLTDKYFVNSGALFDVSTGELASQLGMGCAVAVPGGLVRTDGRSLMTYRWRDVEKIDRKGQAPNEFGCSNYKCHIVWLHAWTERANQRLAIFHAFRQAQPTRLRTRRVTHLIEDHEGISFGSNPNSQHRQMNIFTKEVNKPGAKILYGGHFNKPSKT